MTDRFELGRQTQARFDPEIGAELEAQLAAIAPDFARITIEVAFGDIASRPQLPLDRRAMVVVTTLAALGHDRQLRVWLRFALSSGVSLTEIVESMMQLAVYAGWPRALDGLRAAKDTFTDLGIEVPPASQR